MNVSKIKALEQYRTNLYDWFGEVEAMVGKVEEDSKVLDMFAIFDEVESHLEVARQLIKRIKKL